MLSGSLQSCVTSANSFLLSLFVGSVFVHVRAAAIPGLVATDVAYY